MQHRLSMTFSQLKMDVTSSLCMGMLVYSLLSHVEVISLRERSNL
jgi:hypothetical protein